MFRAFQGTLIVTILLFSQPGNSLRCLSCTGTLQPWLCKFVRICAREDENCGVRKYRTINGEILYDVDCVTDKLCSASQVHKSAFLNRPNGNEAEKLCEECCHGEFCNANGCGSSGYPNDRGPVCFSCNQVIDPSKCGRLSFCRRDEMCAVYEEQSFGTRYFNSNCSPVFDCKVPQPAVIGKKRQTERHRCGACCTGDYCNSDCNGASIPNPTNGGVINGHATTSFPQSVHNDENHKEFVIMYPDIDTVEVMYVLMTTTQPGVVLVEVPFLSMKRNLTLNVGRNHLSFNRSMIVSFQGFVQNKGIYLKSSVPLSVWVMFDYNNNNNNISSRVELAMGYMALPVSRLGTKYIAVASNPHQFTIAAIHDNTTVKVQLVLTSGTVSISGQYYHTGSIVTKTMNRLDALCIESSGLTGTTIFSDKDVAVVSGNYNGGYDSRAAQYLSPESHWGTTFFIPRFPGVPRYNIYLQLAQVGGNTTVNVTNPQGTRQYVVKHHQYTQLSMDSTPVYVESRKPLQVTIFTYGNSSIGPGTFVWIPSTDQYRHNYMVTNPNSVTTDYFDESLVVIIPADKQNGLLVDGIRVHSNEVNPTLSVNSSDYAFMTIPMDGSYHVVTHTDLSLKFGAFVFGKGRRTNRYGHSHYGFPAGIE